MSSGPGCRKHFAVKMWESLRERIIFFVSMRSRRWIHMNVVILQEMFQHFSGSDQKVAVTALTTEFE